MKRLAILVAFLVVAGFAAAQQTQLDVGPGLVDASSPLYGLDTAWDNAAMSIGLKTAGTVVQERAAELRAADEVNNSAAGQRALQEMNRVAQEATSDDTEGVRKAIAVVEEVRAGAPQAAHPGLQNALDSLRGVQERIGGPAGNETPGGGNGSLPGGAGPGQ